MNNIPLSLKQVSIIEAVARYNSFVLAAKHLNMTQSVISRTIKAAEKSLDISLFQRGWGGAEPTALGEVVVQHCVYILAQIQKVENNINHETSSETHLLPYLKWHHLQAIAGVTRFGGASAAAQNLGLKQPAISRAIIAASQYLNLPLFLRKQQGLAPTAIAWQLTALYDELQKQFNILPDKLNGQDDNVIGRVAVGMLPFSAQDLVAKAFGRLTVLHPSIRLVAVTGDYNMLIRALRHGEIDCIMGMLRQPSPHIDLCETFVYTEKYAIIARKNHPCHMRNISPKTLQNQQWIGGPRGTPIREYLEIFFKKFGLTPPNQTCEIHSFTNAEQMIIESDSIAILSYSANKLAALRPELKAIDIDMPHANNTIGLTHMAAHSIPKSVEIFERLVLQFAKDI